MTTIFDREQALENAAGDAELAKELLTMLLHELPDLKDKLKHALMENDNQSLWDHAHKIHGSTAYCGVPALKATAHALEQAIKQENEAQIKEYVAKVCDEVERVISGGTEFLQQLD